MELNNKFSILADHIAEDIDSHCSQITSAIKESSLVINNPIQLKSTSKFSQETKLFIEKRRELRREGSFKDKLEYIELNKLMNKKTREDIRKYNTNLIKLTIRENTVNLSRK